MVKRTARALSALALIEIVVFVVAASRFRVLGLLLVVAVMSVLGVSILVRHAPALARSSLGSNPSSGELGDGGLRLVGGALLAFPGLVSGLVGGLLMVRPVRRLVRPLVASRLSRMIPTDPSESLGGLAASFRRRHGDVVDVTYTTKQPSRGQTSSNALPESP